jgi:hypothetical protein
VFLEQKNIVCTLKWPRVIAKKRKKFLFYKEKSLVGLTPGHVITHLVCTYVVKKLDHFPIKFPPTDNLPNTYKRQSAESFYNIFHIQSNSVITIPVITNEFDILVWVSIFLK